MVGLRKRGGPVLAAATLAAVLAGCYSDRWTTNYSEALNWDIEDSNAVLETTGRTEETERKRIEFLRALWEEELPPYRAHIRYAPSRLKVKPSRADSIHADEDQTRRPSSVRSYRPTFP